MPIFGLPTLRIINVVDDSGQGVDNLVQLLLSNWADIGQVVGTLLSASLTFWIIIIYLKQTEIERLHHKPSLVVESVSVKDGPTLELEISNVGKGAAKNITAQTILEETGPDISVAPYETKLQRNQSGNQLSILGNHLSAQSEPVTFLLQPEFRVLSKDEDELSTGTQMILDLENSGQEVVRFKITLLFVDDENREMSELILDLALPTDERESFYNAVQRSEYYPWYDQATGELLK
ncbi:hypothetical protein [Haloferax sp. ATB1]|uniref:hypothetical protein n=1 Tax=Haloferax sp. ATB1 TaxID=1508454 RepID=UPI000FE13D2E|nr:hypothetical protein [Haloferax sp. ATB1]